jgi:hypothetical protein
MELKFVEPPRELRGCQQYQELLTEMLAELKNHPNKWAEFPLQISNATNLSRWRKQHPEYSFTASGGNTLKNNDPNKKPWVAYIRYNKPEENHIN